MKIKMNDTLFLDGYYKFQGGIDNIFTGPNAIISRTTKIVIESLTIIIWSMVLIFLIYYTLKIYKDKRIVFKILFILRNLFLYIIFTLITFFMCLMIFMINEN
jgi:hypothetical protein